MVAAENNHTIATNEPLWFCLGEMTIPSGTYDGEITLGSIESYFLNVVRTLHLASDLQHRINISLIEAIGITCQSRFSFRPAVPVRVRVLTNVTGDSQTASQLSESQPHEIQPDQVLKAIDYNPELASTTYSKDGGWGYFLIERRVENFDSPDDQEVNLIEIYLYKEG